MGLRLTRPPQETSDPNDGLLLSVPGWSLKDITVVVNGLRGAGVQWMWVVSPFLPVTVTVAMLALPCLPQEQAAQHGFWRWRQGLSLFTSVLGAHNPVSLRKSASVPCCLYEVRGGVPRPGKDKARFPVPDPRRLALLEKPACAWGRQLTGAWGRGPGPSTPSGGHIAALLGPSTRSS